MALTATIHSFSIQLADMDRAVHAELELRVARQPSETMEFMLVRILAYCLEYGDGIELTEGIAATDEPAVVIRDLTGQIEAWIEVGAPDADRLHRGAKRARRAALYTHRDPRMVLAQLSGQRIHRAEALPLYAFEREFITEAAGLLQRRSTLAVTVTERQLYLDIDGTNLSTAIHSQFVADA